jgi:hypothetical protein
VSILLGVAIMVGSVFVGCWVVRHVDFIVGDFLGDGSLWISTFRLLAFPTLIALCMTTFFWGGDLIVYGF